MLTFEAPLIRVRLGKCVGFTDQVPASPPKKVSAAARSLALAHRIVRAIDSGEVRDISDAARRMGVSQPWVSMLVNLTFLAPKIQEVVLLQESSKTRLRLRPLLSLAKASSWRGQLLQAGV